MEHEDFTKFFDGRAPRTVAAYSTCRLSTGATVDVATMLGVADIATNVGASLLCPGGGVLLTIIKQWLKSKMSDFIGPYANKPPFDDLLRNYEEYLSYLHSDMGFFAACSARRRFDELLSERAAGKRNMTFADHFAQFGKLLIVSGTDLRAGKSEMFSKHHSPDFIVADAIRISMGIPFVFKPVIIPNGKYRGVWVDGGVFNNLPFR